MPLCLSRRKLLAASVGAASASLLPHSASATPSRGGRRLITLPVNLWRSVAHSKARREGWAFVLVLETNLQEALEPVELMLSFHAGSDAVVEERFAGAALAAIGLRNLPPRALTGRDPDPLAFWPHGFHVLPQVPQGLRIDRLRARLAVTSGAGHRDHVEAEFPLRDYEQRVRLIFPFRGPGMIVQAGALSSGHMNRSGTFALDALALNPTYGPMASQADDGTPQAYSGWGRPLIAPAAGTIVSARGDRPDHATTGDSNLANSPGDNGNHVVIDHGNGEFSLIAHLRRGSLRVAAGDRVAQGQELGQIGNSGNTSGPHVHYQLQDGPDFRFADGLPARFENVSSLDRGTYFSAR